MFGDGLLLLLAAGDGLRFPLEVGEGLLLPLEVGEGLRFPLVLGEGLRLPLLRKSALLLVSALLVSLSLPRSLSRLALLFLVTGDLLRDFFLQKIVREKPKSKQNVQQNQKVQKNTWPPSSCPLL